MLEYLAPRRAETSGGHSGAASVAIWFVFGRLNSER